MEEVIQYQNQYYILGVSSLADRRTRILKDGDAFGVFDIFGDIYSIRPTNPGFFLNDTRYLSRWELTLHSKRAYLLSSHVKTDDSLLAVDLSNPEIHDEGFTIPRGSLHLFRCKFIVNEVCFEEVKITNFHDLEVPIKLNIKFDNDFADIFEVRGSQRKARGQRLPSIVEKDFVVLEYKGLDEKIRSTRIQFYPSPEKLTESEAAYSGFLRPKSSVVFHFILGSGRDRDSSEPIVLDSRPLEYLERAAWQIRKQEREVCKISSTNQQFNDWVRRSLSDVRILTTSTPFGEYPYAGIPWFCTPFGRDGIITALELLPFDFELAKGVLKFLSATQAHDVNVESEAQPGKIVHEMRAGEMAACNEIPFRKYYGTVDATPLFVILAGEYLKRTGDLEFIRSIRGSIEQALNWMEKYGDLDGDGFVEYARQSESGLQNQGWKDSWDSIFHSDGKLPAAPIALCEVQGYVYAAKKRGAEILNLLGETEEADLLHEQAKVFQKKFERQFWDESLGTYGLALDAQKKLCAVRTSNAGHCLFTGIATQAHAEKVAAVLMDPKMFSGWGIRTLSSEEVRYNPMSYHNGSIWPHDNALIAEGFAHYGLRANVLQIFNSFFEASVFFDSNRLPELFCGFERRFGEGPTLYPVACSPQAWSSGAVFMILKACLGLSFNGFKRLVTFHRPMLPEAIHRLELLNLKFPDGSCDIQLKRYGHDVGVTVLRKDPGIEITVIK